MLKTTLKLVVSALVLWLVLRGVPLREIGAQLAAARPVPVLAAIALTAPLMGLGALLFQRILASQRVTMRVGEILALNAACQFYELFLPSFLAGGAVRWYRLRRSGAGSLDTLVVIASNRLVETMTTVAVGLVCWLADPPAVRATTARLGGAAVPVAFAALLLALVAVQVVVFERADSLARLVARLPRRVARGAPGARLARFADRLRESAGAVAALDLRARLEILALSLARHLVGCLIFWCLGRALELPLSFAAAGFVRAVTMLALLLPLSFAGVGVREGGIVLAIAAYGVPAPQAVALSFLLLGRELVARLAGGVVELRGWLRGRSSPPAGEAAVPEAIA